MALTGSGSIAEVEAPAKVNLFLGVLDRRPDGYHELETLFQAIDLTDRVRLERTSGSVSLDVSQADLGPERENLAYRAARRLLADIGSTDGLRIELTKRIPVGAGLGGGSSDAAAVLKCAAALLDLALDDGRLHGIAAELGSDVPFFLGRSPLALGRGRGDELEPIDPLPVADLVVVSPPVHVSTAWAYHALDDARSSGRSTDRPLLPGRPATWSDVAAVAHNDFQDIVAEGHTEVARSLAALSAAGAEAVLMSGSGSSSFGIFRDRDAAERAAEALSGELGWPCHVARTLTALPTPRTRGPP